MLLLAAALAASPAPAAQILAGPAFETFARHGDRACPARGLRAITPADLDREQDMFIGQLAPPARRHLAAHNRAGTACASRNGLSCSVGETLDAMRRTRMLGAFGTFACTHHGP